MMTCMVKIPNVEIKSIYRNQIIAWFDKQVKSEDRSVLHKAVLTGDTEAVAGYVTKLLKKSISVFDNSESFYHGFSCLFYMERLIINRNQTGKRETDVLISCSILKIQQTRQSSMR